MIILIFFIGIVMFLSTRTVIDSTLTLVGDKIHNTIRSKRMTISDPEQQNSEIIAQITEVADQFRTGETSGFSGNLLRSTSGVLILGLLVVVFELGILTVFVSHKIAGPIYRLDKFAEAYGSGDLTSRIHLRQGDQLMNTADKFNAMGDQVHKRIALVEKKITAIESTDPQIQASLNEIKEVLKGFKLS
jgi:methyl-accepting chemotaxis protein